MSRSRSIFGSVATNFDSLNEPVGVAVFVVCGCCCWFLLFCCLALATESWRGGFYCRFPTRWVWFVCLALH